MNKVNIIGSIFGQTGYDRHTRGLANGLNDIGVDVKIECPKAPQWERFCSDSELKMINKPFDRERTTISISQPPFWRLSLSEKPNKFFGFLVWEGDRIPEYWLEYLMDPRVDKILVPSEHTKQAILNTWENHVTNNPVNPITNKIIIVPHGFDPSIFYQEKPKTKSEKFTFIANKGWSQGEFDRGGLQLLFRAFSEEFTKDDNVLLKVKINSAYNPPDWNMQNELEKLKLDRKGKAEMLITDEQGEDNIIRELYNEGDVFISTSMAESFNLPGIEAMACGLPNIQTYYGGQTDYITKENGWLITEGELGVFSKELSYEDTQWFKAKISSIGAAMRYCYKNPEEVKEKGKQALADSPGWIWRESAKKIKTHL